MGAGSGSKEEVRGHSRLKGYIVKSVTMLNRPQPSTEPKAEVSLVVEKGIRGAVKDRFLKYNENTSFDRVRWSDFYRGWASS